MSANNIWDLIQGLKG